MPRLICLVSEHEGKIKIEIPDPLTPAEAFTVAERLCSAAYRAEGGPAKDPDERFEQQLAREARKAPAFEELYCTLRDIADDWHREAVARRDGVQKARLGAPPLQYDAAFCDVGQAIEQTFDTALERIRDWDY